MRDGGREVRSWFREGGMVGEREVARTVWPFWRARCVRESPKPLDAPVMSQVSFRWGGVNVAILFSDWKYRKWFVEVSKYVNVF